MQDAEGRSMSEPSSLTDRQPCGGCWLSGGQMPSGMGLGGFCCCTRDVGLTLALWGFENNCTVSLVGSLIYVNVYSQSVLEISFW